MDTLCKLFPTSECHSLPCPGCDPKTEDVMTPQEFTNYSTCTICTLAAAMRNCTECKFYSPRWTVIDIIDPLATVDDWASDPWTMEEIASEEMNRRPEVGF